ncbi:phage tail protein [Providencia manganoxydans]|uniref:phage tail protein n=1 Tax=Providencia manganoxydans TaxID=2923283 RepID=UPI0029C0130D|nr:phage tail protein [Providencia manganoxydans]MDX4944337.1 phage tail protein [Providencia manganoxydans]
MKKLTSLREYLSNKIPFLKENPENLYLFVENGRVISTLANTPSYEYEYTVNIIIERFSGDQDILIAVINNWLREHQSDISANPDKRRQDFRFEAVILDNKTAHISIDLNLTERVLAKDQDGKWVIASTSEPSNPFDEWPTTR